MVAPYKRPEIPSPEGMAAATLSLSKRLDAHAAAERIAEPIRRRLSPSELAPALRANREQAAERDEVGAMQEAGRVELLGAFNGMALIIGSGQAPAPEDVASLVYAAQEFLGALGSKSEPRKRDGLKAMREAIASLDRARGGGN
jgi:hypothetical protein